jgi:hypothetical protein
MWQDYLRVQQAASVLDKMECLKQSAKITSLRSDGVIVINLLGAETLVVWLIAGQLELVQKGYLFL